MLLCGGPAAGCFLVALWMVSARFLGVWLLQWRLCATMKALSECLLFAVVLVLLRMLFAV